MKTGHRTARPRWVASVCAAALFLCVTLWTVESIPASPILHVLKPRRPKCTSATCELFLKQMQNPAEMFTVLLIIGADVVQKAIAQQSGRHKITLVPFSFGWVACAFGALMSAFGDGTFMPQPDYPSIVIDVRSRNKKINGAWIIGRLIRDLERQTEKHYKNKVALNTGLLVTFYEMESDGAGKPHSDWLYWSFYITVLVQFIIATIPVYAFGANKRDWSIALLTVAGTLFAVFTGSLKAWRREKFGHSLDKSDPLGPYAHLDNDRDFVLTRGNGHKHVFVLQRNNAKRGVRLYDLAGTVSHATNLTRCWAFFNAVLWIVFLLVAGGLRDNTWFLFGVGAVGMLQNVVAAGFARSTRAHGIPLHLTGTTFGENNGTGSRPKVMKVLFQITKQNVDLGRALRPEFFPDIALGKLERMFWNKLEETNKIDIIKAEVEKASKDMGQDMTEDERRTLNAINDVWPCVEKEIQI